MSGELVLMANDPDRGYDFSSIRSPDRPPDAPKGSYDFNTIQAPKRGEFKFEEQREAPWRTNAMFSMIIGIVSVVILVAGLFIPYIGNIPILLCAIGFGLGIRALVKMLKHHSTKHLWMIITGLVLNGLLLLLTILVFFLLMSLFVTPM